MAAGVLKSLGELTFQISPDLAGFAKQLESGMSLAVGSTLGTLGVAFEALGKAMLKKFTLPLAIGAAANIAQFQALDREIRSTITLLGTAPSVVNKVWDEFSATIARVSTEVGGLERDIADGLYQAISAGVPRGDIGDFLNVAQMAAIADKTADMTTAVDGLTTASNAFSSEGLTFSEIADIMFATVAKGKTTMGELSQSIGRAAGIANNAGVKFAEFQAVIGTLTLGGFKTAEAVSFLRAAITGLLRPGEDMDAIFEKLGFSSAEAAIPIIGLQPAFQAVVDAAEGSTSKLQELIGTSEGVSAILGITGANAEKFAGVLDATSNATGFLVNAFEIAEGGIGRSFGRMTEAFDRLGNRLGAIASKIAAPFVEVVTDIVNRVIGAFKKMEPVIDTLVDVFKAFAKVLELPGLKAVVAGLIAMAVVFGSLLGVLAPFILALGVLLKTFIIIRSLIIVTKAWAAANTLVVAATAPVLSLYQKLLRLLGTIFPRAVKKATVAQVGFTSAVNKTKLALSPLALGGALLAITVIIAAGIFLYRKYKDAMESIRNQALLTSRGIDTMADSLGIVLEPLEELAALASGDRLTTEFVLKNTGTIKQIKEIQLNLGNLAARDYVAGVILQFKSRGATTEELERLLANLEQATSQTFNIEVEFITDKAAFEGLSAQVEFVARKFDTEFGVPRELIPDLEEVAQQLLNIQRTQGPEAFLRAVSQVEEQLEGLPGATDRVVGDFFSILEEASGRKFGFDIGGVISNPLLDFGDLISQLEEQVPGFLEASGKAVEVFDEELDNLTPNMRRYLNLVKSGEGKDFLGPEAVERVGKLGDALGDAFARAKTAIHEAFDVIEDRAIAAVPFLDVFEVKEIDFDAIIAGKHLFDELTPQITALKKEFIDNTTPEGQAFFQKFLSMSPSEQSALALLSDADLDTFVEHTLDNFNSAFEAAAAEKKFSADLILGPIQDVLTQELQAVIDDAEEAGLAISNAVNDMLVTGGEGWVDTVATWIQNTGKALTSTEFGGVVSLGGPSIVANITVYNNNVTVGPSASGDPSTDVRRALQSVQN